ncbi:MAG TPA: threonine--tRNA ligase [Clostridiales bacterium]|nr:MAG: threonine--tRNA ligase [Clostridiales bacterium GWD2_32_59]HAN10167.1 threonine--tRNA ligase [Clostridiales bacterium]
MIKITFKDGSVREFESGISVLDVATNISEGLARNSLGALIDGELSDLRKQLTKDCKLTILTFDDDEGKDIFWHTSSHILAQALKRLYPSVKLAIGPAIANGFYYDVDVEGSFTETDIVKLEAEMQKIVKEELNLEYFELSRDDAIKLMQEKDEPYKVELIQDLPIDATISFYRQGEFVDLCAGPHVMNTKIVKAIKILNVAGAYWRGSEKNKMLTRIYATSFTKKSLLDEYLTMLEEAKRRDHKKIGKELDLFTFHPEAPGACFWHPKGLIMWQQLENYWREMHKNYGYTEVQTPGLAKKILWETSGHWDHYQDDMYHFDADENETLCLKPMDCPFDILIYNTKQHSYKDLPVRFNELGRIFRNEKSGQLNGLFRVRQITQDDAHIMCTEEQVLQEISSIIKMQQEFYKTFDLKINYFLSTRPDDYLGEIETWDKAEDDLKNALISNGINSYGIKDKDGAFYGPKIDVQAKDALGRTWQLATIQLDFQLPSRFDMIYIDKNGEKRTPVMIHRAVFGSFERFIGIITEQFEGAFPTWLSPVQVKVLPISDKFNEYAKSVADKLLDKNVRAEIDVRAEKIGFKIRESQLSKTPYMLVVGEEEQTNNTVSVRKRGEGDVGVLPIDEFVGNILSEIKDKK